MASNATTSNTASACQARQQRLIPYWDMFLIPSRPEVGADDALAATERFDGGDIVTAQHERACSQTARQVLAPG